MFIFSFFQIYILKIWQHQNAILIIVQLICKLTGFVSPMVYEILMVSIKFVTTVFGDNLNVYVLSKLSTKIKHRSAESLEIYNAGGAENTPQSHSPLVTTSPSVETFFKNTHFFNSFKLRAMKCWHVTICRASPSAGSAAFNFVWLTRQGSPRSGEVRSKFPSTRFDRVNKREIVSPSYHRMN